MSERLENVGRLEEKKQHARLLLLKLKGLREQMHRDANPYRDLDVFEPEKIRVAAAEAVQAKQDLDVIVREIRGLCDELGEKAPVFD